MKRENQEKRRQQIEAAAYELLSEKGYRATSMLAIAKRASASNETLYKWYGNKQALFEALVRSNARQVRELLLEGMDGKAHISEILQRIGPVLLHMVTGERAVALNRAAAADADETGSLGRAMAEAGRGSIAPLITRAFEQARERRELSFDHSDELVDLYLSLLIGDLQIRRVSGALTALTDKEIRARSVRAWEVIRALHEERG